MSTFKPLDKNESIYASNSGVGALEDLAKDTRKQGLNETKSDRDIEPLDVTIDNAYAHRLKPEVDRFQLGVFRNEKGFTLGNKDATYASAGKYKINRGGQEQPGSETLFFLSKHGFKIENGELKVDANENGQYESIKADVGNDAVYDKIVAYFQDKHGSSGKRFEFYDSAMFKSTAESSLATQISSQSSQSTMTLNFSGLTDVFLDTNKDNSGATDQFIALALFGAFSDDGLGAKIDVDIATQTVTLTASSAAATQVAAQKLSDRLFLRDRTGESPTDISRAAYRGFRSGIAVFIHPGEKKSTLDDDVLWDAASYYSLKNEVDSIVSHNAEVASHFSDLEKTNEDGQRVKVEYGNLAEEVERLKATGITPESFVYFTFVVDQGVPKMWRIATTDPTQMTQQGPKTTPVSNWDEITNLNLTLPLGMSLAELPELQTLLNDQATFDALPWQFIAFNTNDYLFETRTQDGRNILVLRAPIANSKAPSAQYTIAQSTENADASITPPQGNENEAIHLTQDELLAMRKSIPFVDPETGLVNFYYNGQTHPIKIFNPVTGQAEDACGYRWAFSQNEAVKIAVSLIKQLQASGYGEGWDLDSDTADLDLEDGMPEFNFGGGIDFAADAEPDEVLEAAADFFEDADPEYWYPANDRIGPFNSEYDFSSAQAWSDPENKNVTVLLNDLPITRRRAAFFVMALLQYIEDSKKFGMTPTESRKTMWSQQRRLGLEQMGYSLGGSLVTGGVLTVLGMAGQYQIMKRLQKGDSSKDDDEKVKQAIVNDPNWRPDFVTKLYDPTPDDPTQKPKGVKEYKATPEREEKIKYIMDCLAKGDPVLLLGESAQGKTALMIEVARRLSQATTEDAARRLGVPAELRGKKVFQLDWDILEANTKYVGQYAEKIRLLKLYIEMHPDVIFFIDECHKGIGSGEGGEGRGSGLNDFYQKFKEMWGEKQFPSVLSTTTAELRQHFVDSGYDKSGAVRRRFKTITLDTYQPEDVKAMMRTLVFEYVQKNLLLDMRSEDVDKLVEQIYDSLPVDQKNLLLDKTVATLRGLADYIIKNRIKNFDAAGTMDDHVRIDPELWSEYVLGRSEVVSRLEDVNSRIADLHTSLRSRGWLAYVKKSPARAWAWFWRKHAKLITERDQCKKELEELENKLIAKGAIPPGLADHYLRQLDFVQGSIQDLERLLSVQQARSESARKERQRRIQELKQNTTEKLQLREAKLDQMSSIINSSPLGDQDPEALRFWQEAQDLRSQALENAKEAHDLERSVMSQDEVKKQQDSLERFRQERAKILKRLSAITGVKITNINPKNKADSDRLHEEIENVRTTARRDFKGYTIKSSDVERFVKASPDLKAAMVGDAAVARSDIEKRYKDQVQAIKQRINEIIFGQAHQKIVVGDPNSELKFYRSLGFDVYHEVGEDQKKQIYVRYLDEGGRIQSTPIGNYISLVLSLKENSESYGQHLDRLKEIVSALMTPEGEIKPDGMANLKDIFDYIPPTPEPPKSTPPKNVLPFPDSPSAPPKAAPPASAPVPPPSTKPSTAEEILQRYFGVTADDLTRVSATDLIVEKMSLRLRDKQLGYRYLYLLTEITAVSEQLEDMADLDEATKDEIIKIIFAHRYEEVTRSLATGEELKMSSHEQIMTRALTERRLELVEEAKVRRAVEELKRNEVEERQRRDKFLSDRAGRGK